MKTFNTMNKEFRNAATLERQADGKWFDRDGVSILIYAVASIKCL